MNNLAQIFLQPTANGLPPKEMNHQLYVAKGLQNALLFLINAHHVNPDRYSINANMAEAYSKLSNMLEGEAESAAYLERVYGPHGLTAHRSIELAIQHYYVAVKNYVPKDMRKHRESGDIRATTNMPWLKADGSELADIHNNLGIAVYREAVIRARGQVGEGKSSIIQTAIDRAKEHYEEALKEDPDHTNVSS